VAPGSRQLGLLLPYTALHHLLAREIAAPFVLTSGNRSDEPIAYRDDDARERLAPLADFRLVHDRPIQTRCDDSVARSMARGRVQLLRRARGFAPRPVALPFSAPRAILACGGELKSTICLAKDARAFVSHHLGDLEHFAAFEAFREAIAHYERLFDARPAVIAHDLHPDYLSTKYAIALADRAGLALEGVQHHHAHAAACLAESDHAGRAIAVCFDGLGYGSDGSLWGGELLLADYADFERAGRLAPVAMPGGTAAIREPWRMALSHLAAAFGFAVPADLDVVRRNAARWDAVLALVKSGTNAPLTSSVGRLFDAVAAIAGLRDRVTFEGQAAILLEQCADPLERGRYPMPLGDEPLIELHASDLIRGVVDDVRAGQSAPIVSARFHNTLAQTVVDACARLRDRTGLAVVALSGGVFQNALLQGRVAHGLEAAGFGVLTHAALPANDGGVSFGQAVVAAARDRRRSSGRC
jgi:hydrogenase maturation protein HypF